MSNLDSIVYSNLLLVVDELVEQAAQVRFTYSDSELSYDDEMAQLREYLEVREFSVAYEAIVATLEKHKFFLTGRAVVGLLEVGLIMRYKTEREEDSHFDSR